MALPTIDQSFVEQFEADVHLAYQRMGSKLRGTVRTKNNVKNKTTFQKVGKGTAQGKGRHGLVPVMNLDHSNVSVTLEDKYAAEYIDKLDELRINHDERMVVAESSAAALGRATDDQLVTAMEGTTNTLSETTNGMTFAFAMTILETFGNADVPDDGNRYCMLAWDNWTQLLQLKEFTSRDYVDDLPLVKSGVQAIRWNNIVWFPFSGASTSGSNKIGIAYHKSAVGHAIGSDIKTEINYVPERAAYLITSYSQMNGVLIDANGCIKLTLKA